MNGKGFSIIEIMIALSVASVLSIVISTVMFEQYGQLLQGAAQSRLRVEGENVLLSLEDELLFATDFGSGLKSDLSDSNAPSGGWNSSTTPTDTLIVYETALTADRRDPNRDFVYKKGSSCSNSFNIAINNLVYFTAQNSSDSYRSLYRRTVVPQYTTCGINYKRMTCPESNVVSPCAGADAKLSEKVVDFQLEYFTEDNIATADPNAAELVKMTLTLGEKIYGKNIAVPTSITMKKVN